MAKVSATPNLLEWELLHPEMTIEHLGYIAYYFPASSYSVGAAETFMRQGYLQSAGVAPDDFFNQPGHQFDMRSDGSIQYPSDPVLPPLAKAKFGEEELFFYQHALFAIRQPGGAHKVWRLD